MCGVEWTSHIGYRGPVWIRLLRYFEMDFDTVATKRYSITVFYSE